VQRRELLAGLASGGALLGLGGCAVWHQRPSAAKVVVIGGGFGGATAAKYLRLLSAQAVEVVLIEPNPDFVSAPMSNLVISGALQIADITSSYEELRRRHGIVLVRDRVVRLDAARKLLTLGSGSALGYDKLVLAPGIEPMVESIEGLAAAHAAGTMRQGWIAGADTVGLRDELAAMPDGGVFAISIPEAPYRCPPAPYERASLVAAYCKRFKPRSKVLVLDANPDVTAMSALFKQAWTDLYGGILEYRNHYKAVAVDAAARTVRFEVADDVQADVWNVFAPVRAGSLAVLAGLANVNDRWCRVDFASFASTVAPEVHIVGDSIQAAPQMPKSGHMANAHAKVAAAAIVAELQGRSLDAEPMLTNTCYSFVSPTEAIHSAAVYGYAAAEQIFKPRSGASGTSAARSPLEAAYAKGWAHNIWADMLA
jgi:NADPH-dependent 2,4-dienoyl-CoA reductase/sulfur reductase-like enzyme